MATQNKIQRAYTTAKLAFETAKNGYESEIATSGLKARIDAANDEKTLDALAKEDEPIFAKWNVSKLEKALSRAENALIEWSLNIAVAMKPQSRIEIESLRDTLRRVTRHDANKAKAIELAMSLPA
jgi:hypothetical protein